MVEEERTLPICNPTTEQGGSSTDQELFSSESVVCQSTGHTSSSNRDFKIYDATTST